ncbi:CoxG family protein [Geodermatophilus marinus]|uniref:CoxG family protein n=1 Tax=Geodermatophilus sp. LHW52908 TaxID=2303986 RepID=UPI000E3D9E6C|nr:carbon monoxide dehydrogenase subunit G [Geodermatophilus sp. LHW52908]RFU20197.1 carbon monoxide dehydrogenase [Geodermatophilus sp. LHW52908]
MNLDGSAVLHADPERVWSVITDPAVLARTIPGCESLEQTGEDSYRMNVSVGVGAVRGTYAGEVRLSDKDHPKSYVMHASGAGAPGNARATVTIGLEPADGGTTTLTYSADAVVGGPVAGVGQRMMTGVAKRMAGQFFSAIDDELTGRAAPVAAPAEPRPSAAAVSETGVAAPEAAAAAPQVFAGRAAAAPAAVGGEVRTLALGAVGGAALTLIGVLVGYRLGRRP